ncbi:MAG TPA: MerR family transcriptional regulator [Clostridiales bacterium]|nr:MerR family transcriptional regulator [Clostridiales bacterium]
MDIRNCKMCGRIFKYNNVPYCHSCVLEREETFVKVRDYIWDHPEANVSEVAEETEVDEKIILEFLREGRLELKEESIGLPCERCGRPIRTGRYCSECSRELEVELKKGMSTSPEHYKRKTGPEQMYIADRMKKKKY